jgi:hydrogenase maturation factor HypF (carbamoyltransferase family)
MAEPTENPLNMFLVPCSCGKTFAVPEGYDRHGTRWARYLICPNCGKRHDPRNRLLRISYQQDRFWKVDGC